MSLDTSVEAVAAGSSYLPLDFTNTAHSACRLTGYPDVAFISGVPGHRIGGPATRDQGVAAHPVTLAPGATAHAWLAVSAAANYPAGQCHPVTAHVAAGPGPGPGRRQLRGQESPRAARPTERWPDLGRQPVLPGRAKRDTGQ